ncbi:hypothetical protein [Streptomyces ureilyticus]|uniref:hypothetical protein n=1 Tax=Streptomyces ureilyticus TaxID=1775131 RepID=UPI001F1DEEB2|nr:hypothetical protein [Streptomyces ureilyticus]
MPSTPQYEADDESDGAAYDEAESLLNALDPLPYPQRMRELATRVRDLHHPLRPVLEALEPRGPYERGVAIIAASIARDAEWIAAHVADPDPYIRGHALRVADSLQVPDNVYESALADAPEAIRRGLLRAIAVGRGRTALADRLIDGLRRDWGDAEAARLLPGCSADTVARLLPALFHAATGWRQLAKRHPHALLDATERELTRLPEAMRGTWWTRYADAVAAVAPAEPLRVLDLLESLGPATLPQQLRAHIPAFATADPQRMVRLILTPAWSGAIGVYSMSASVRRRLARSGAPELIAYGRTLVPYGRLPPLLKALPPAQRHAFYTEVYESRGAGPLDESLLEALPRSHVADEARRMAATAREGGSREMQVLRYESFLPVAEVRERLVEATRRPAGDDRAEAWPLLVLNADRSGDPEAVNSVLEEMGRLRNEQDPVREAALGALARVRPALFTEDAEPRLDRIAVDAVQAPDSSSDSRYHLSRLAVGVLREHAASGRRELVNWALRTLVRISGNTGAADLGRLDHTLRRGQEHQVYEALRPWIEAGAEKSDYSLAFALARAVGRRAAGMPELQELLWQAIRYGRETTAREAVDLWLEPPATRSERAARILAVEPSAGALPPVQAIVTRCRTDLLDLLLADTPPYGRFLTKGSPWVMGVPPDGVRGRVDRDIRRWVPRQQQAVARQLAALAEDDGLPLWERATAIEQSALVPGIGADLVRRWTVSEDAVLAEAALAALARTDRPADALPELLAHAGGEHARVAVYAATQASRHAAPSVLAEPLRAMLLGPDVKVTSRKEAARLAAVRLPVPRAAELLTEAYAREGTHRDVRAACVAFAGPLLAEEAVWGLLGDAAGAEPVLRTAVLRVSPLDLSEPHRERYARLVRDVCDTGDPETATLAFDALARWAPWSPDAPTVLADAAANLAERVSWHAAANGLVTAAAGSERGGEGLLRALRALAEAEGAAPTGAALPGVGGAAPTGEALRGTGGAPPVAEVLHDVEGALPTADALQDVEGAAVRPVHDVEGAPSSVEAPHDAEDAAPTGAALHDAEGAPSAVEVPHGAEGLARAVVSLHGAEGGLPPVEPLHDAEEQRDRPARRRIENLVLRLSLHGRTAPRPIRPAALAASELLAEYDDFVPQAAEIVAFHLDLDTEPTRLEDLAALTESRPALAARMAQEIGDRLRRQVHEGDPEALLHVARRLTAHGGHAQGLLAVALTSALGSRTGWPAPWREHLRHLRRHALPDVRDAALAVVTAHE